MDEIFMLSNNIFNSRKLAMSLSKRETLDRESITEKVTAKQVDQASEWNQIFIDKFIINRLLFLFLFLFFLS